jgi:Abortive infection C-terminus
VVERLAAQSASGVGEETRTLRFGLIGTGFWAGTVHARGIAAHPQAELVGVRGRRRATDPEGAITAARSLVESVCKLILEELGVEYNDSADLPTLYKTTAKQLKLAPSDHTERQFKQILGCQLIVEGMGSLRNRISDAHGKGRTVYRPGPRQAELAVNVAGTMASLLDVTWEERGAES